MQNMFFGAQAFNNNISTWNTTNVVKMSGMFADAKSFNQNLSWDIVKVKDMSSMFTGAELFNQDLSQWNVAKVTSHDQFNTNSGMIDNAKLPKFKN